MLVFFIKIITYVNQNEIINFEFIKMNFRNIIAQIILPAIVGIVWALIGMFAEPDWNQFKIEYGIKLYPCVKWLWDNRIILGIIISIVIFAIIVIMALIDKPSKRWLKVYLKHLMSELFNDDYSKTRITILKKVSGFRMMLVYIKHVLFHCAKQHIKEKTFILHLKRTPNLFSDYLMIYVRCSNPHPNGSSTYFPIAESSNDVCGLSSYCLYTKSKQIVNTEYISDFYTPLRDNYNKFERAKIKQYIKDNKINEEMIKCIHRLSNHIIAEPIFDENENIWGALVVDIDSPEKDVFTTDCEDKLSTAIRIISFTLCHLK